MKEKTTINPRVKEAVYITVTALSFYHVAKYLKLDTSLALVIGTSLAQILVMETPKIKKK